MLPTAKRAADDAWQQGDRVRAAFVRATNALTQLSTAVAGMPDGSRPQIPTGTIDLFNMHIGALATQPLAQPVELPRLPNECWRIVMEFVLERRTTAKFGVEPREWWPVASYVLSNRIGSLRLVSRAWCRLASDLVQSIRVPTEFMRLYQPSGIASLFPHTRLIQYTIRPKYAKQDKQAIKDLVGELDAIASRRFGPPFLHASRIQRLNMGKERPSRFKIRYVGQCDTVYVYSSPGNLIDNMSSADVILVNLTRDVIPSPIEVPDVIRVKTIVLMGGHKSMVAPTLEIFRAIGAEKCANIRVYASRQFQVRDHAPFEKVGIRCRPDKDDDKETAHLIREWAERLRAVFAID
jgi:hypothetical protein